MNPATELDGHWKKESEESFQCELERDGLIFFGHVLRGGDDRWTSYVIVAEKGRPKKRGRGFIAGKTLRHVMLPRLMDRDEALRVASAVFAALTADCPVA